MTIILDDKIYTHVEDIGHGNHKRIALGTGNHQDWEMRNTLSLSSPIDSSLWDELAEKNTPGLINYRNTGYLIGSKVLDYVPGTQSPRGQARYTPEFYGTLFMASFSDFYPDPANAPDVINYVVSYPLDDRHHRHDLKSLFEGKWLWQTPNGRYSVTVNECVPMPESSGAIGNLAIGINGKKPDSFLKHSREHPRQHGVLIDLGMETIQIGVLGFEGEVITGKHRSFYDMGARTILMALKRAFEESPPHFRFIKQIRGGLPLSSAISILKDNIYQNAGETIDCQHLVKMVTTSFTNRVELEIQNLTNWIVQYILVAGGGIRDAGAPFTKMLEKHIKNTADNIKQVLPDDQIIYGTVRGNALTVMLIWDKQRDKVRDNRKR